MKSSRNQTDLFEEVKVAENSLLSEMWQYNTSNIPKWMMSYFDWHREQKAMLTPETWRSFRYLVLRCTDADTRCGGTADRLRPVPAFLRIAYETNRIFLIRWSRPCQLEEFLEPNYVDWSVPSWFEPTIDNPMRYANAGDSGKKIMSLSRSPTNPRMRIVEGRLQKEDGGYSILRKLVGEDNLADADYNAFYHDMFRMLFRPSPPVAK